jgi:TonB-dependent starch-binding outer membrane protein SusC
MVKKLILIMKIYHMKTKYIWIAFLAVFSAVTFVPATYAQENSTPEGSTLKLKFSVVDKSGHTISDAQVVVGEGGIRFKANSGGEFEVNISGTPMLVISASKFETLYVPSSSVENGKPVVLVKKPVGLSQTDLIEMPFRKMYKRDLVGSVSTITDKGIEISNQNSIVDVLAGKMAGLNVTVNPSEPLGNASSWNIRGLSRSASNNEPLVIVDGIERDINDIMPEEIGSVSVLKDVTSKILYGSQAANGVILIKTKRGIKYARERKISIEYGSSLPTNLPEYLNSADYATMYNQARANDGLNPYYSQKQIDGYRTGLNAMLYPDNNYQDLLFNKSMHYQKATAQFRGGDKNVQYYVNGSYLGEGGYEVGKNSNSPNRIAIRANLDFKVNDWFSAFIDISGHMDFRNTNYTTYQSIFSMAANQRPNAYPIWVNDINDPEIVYYGAGENGILNSSDRNLYGEVMDGGLRNNMIRRGEMNVGFNLNLDQYVKGLSGKAYVTLDTYNYTDIGKNEGFESYHPVYLTDAGGNTTIVGLEQMSILSKTDNLSRLGDDYARNYGYYGQLSYEKNFAEKHKIQSDLVLFQAKKELLGSTQDDLSRTSSMRLNYAFDNRLIAEVDMALMRSVRFAKDKQYGFFPSAGLGWVISDEGFFKKNKTLSYLKLKTSAGLIGIDRYAGSYRFEDRFSYSGTVYFGSTASDKVTLTNLVNSGNPDLTYEKSLEFNITAEAMLFDDKLSAELSYFRTDRSGIIDVVDSYSQVNGDYSYYKNIGEVSNQGIEVDFNWTDHIGELKYSIELNAIWSKAKSIKDNVAIGYPDNRNIEGKPLDTYFGLSAQGIFTSLQAIQSAPVHTFGTVSVGDLQYVNTNGDQVIDYDDMHAIGNMYPRLQAGLNINLSYKKIELALSGSGKFGYDIATTNSYYFMDGNDKYSSFVSNYYNPSTGYGKYPALTSQFHANNQFMSDLWLQSGNFFKIRDAKLSYTIRDKYGSQASFKKVKLFVRGSNLFTFTSFKDLDPENISAGITTYPYFRTFTGGINVEF